MASVSLTVIAKNEASNIEVCIAPVKDLVDEVVVVDTGSTDDTVEIAQRLGARVFHFPWQDSFAAARNEAIEHALGDWIFVLDADDRIVPSERDKLRALFASLGDENVGWTFRCVNLAIDGGIGTELEQFRLFRRRPDIRWRYRAHEQIAPAILETGARLAPTGIRIAHVGYVDPDLVEKKFERNLRLIEMDLEGGHTGDPILAFYRANVLAELGRNAEAIVALSFCLPGVDPRTDMARMLCMNLVRALRAEAQLGEALEVMRASRTFNPDDAALASIEAEMLIEIGDLGGAGAVLAPVATEPKLVLSIPDLRARALLAEVLLSAGHIDAAEETARAITQARPGFGPAWLVLADALLATGKLAEAGAIASRFETIRGGETARVVLRAAHLLHEGREDEAASLVVDAHRTHPSALLSEFHARMIARTGQPLTTPLVACLGAPWPAARSAKWNPKTDARAVYQVHLGP
jgi:Flp pilus assembly protein TadD